MSGPDAPRPRVVILGGGFGGINAARALRNAPVDVTLVDRRNHHLFQPLLYQVATAALNPSDIAYPIRRILRRQKNATVVLAEVLSIDAARRRVVLAEAAIEYDYLIIATGATHSYFGHDNWSRDAPGLKSIEDALAVRRRILLAFEAAEREADPAKRQAWLTFVVVGGGPTGVELAGALAEIARHVLARDFRHIDPRSARILLVEAGPRILAAYPPALSTKAVRQLARLGAVVLAGRPVTRIDGDGVTLGGAAPTPAAGSPPGKAGAAEKAIAAKTVLWAAGVAASPLARSLGAPLDRAGRVLVKPDLTVPGAPNIYVVGDLASLQQDGKPVPGVAPAAIQMGRYAAAAILRALRGLTARPFRSRDKGSLATIGRASAVADFGRFTLSGYPAWLAWLVVHIFFLIGFRNRLLVIFEWAWTYLTYDRGARLITGGPGESR